MIYNLILFIVLVFFVVSCGSGTDPTTAKNRNVEVVMDFTSIEASKPPTTFSRCEGVVWDKETKDILDGGIMTVSGIEMDYNPIYSSDSSFRSITTYAKDHRQDSALIVNAFGRTAKWGISGNPDLGIAAFDTVFYTLKKMQILSPGYLDVVSKSQGMQLEWNADERNINGVNIFIDTSKYYHPYPKPGWPRTVPDNGSYFIPLYELPLTKGVPFRLYISRTYDSEFKVNGSIFRIFIYSSVESYFILGS